MKISKLFSMIYKEVLQFVPLFQVVWAGTVIFGFVMLIVSFVLKKNSVRKKSFWIVGGIGALLVASSGTQLIASLL